MTELSEHRRKLIKSNTVRGTPATVESDTSSVTLPSCSGVPIQRLEVKGNTFQKQLQGYNLFDLSRGKNSGNATVIEKTSNSITLTSPAGQKYISHNIEIPDWQNLFGKQLTLITRYKTNSLTLQGCIRFLGMQAGLANTGSSDIIGYAKVGELAGEIKVTGTFTKLPNLETYPNAKICLLMYANSNGIINEGDYITYTDIMVVEGDYTNQDLPYEEYCGGIPSPNPGQSIPIYGQGSAEDILLGDVFASGEYQYTDYGGVTFMLASSKMFRLPQTGVRYMIRCSLGSYPTEQVSIAIASSPEGLMTGSGATELVNNTTNYELEVSDSFYIGVGETWEGITLDKMDTYWGYLRDSTLTITPLDPVEIGRTEIPAFPQEIQNADNLSVDVNGTTVSIPSEARLADGTVVPLRFGKIGDYADKLLVDTLNKKVIYQQNIEKINALNDTTHVSYVGTSSGSKNVYYYNLYLRKKGLYVTDGNNIPICNNTTNFFKKVGEPTDNTLNGFRYPSGINTRLYYFLHKDFGASNTDLFKEWLAENETIIQYVLDTPSEYDLTDTEFGQQLLKLSAPYGQTGIIKVGADLEVSGVKALYYSLENEDKQVLTISCVDEEGNLIVQREHSVRAGTKYKVVAPEIEGYLPLESEFEGDIATNSEVTIIYKEK